MTEEVDYRYDCNKIDEPKRCSKCNGQGKFWRWRIDDRRYPAKCQACAGSGICNATQEQSK